MLVARVGGLACAIPIAHVIETMRPLPIGIAVVRGLAILIDAASLLGQTPREQARFVVVRVGSRTIALLVDAVLDVQSFDAATFSDLPPLIQAITRDNVTALGAFDRELFIVLDTARLAPEVG